MISAEVHTDCRTAEATFDATPWFLQASDHDIKELAECGWGGDYPADNVALYMQDLDANVSDVFDMLRLLRKRSSVGFECHVDADQAMEWVGKERPALLETLKRADDEA